MLGNIKKSMRKSYDAIVEAIRGEQNLEPKYMGRTFAAGFAGSMWITWGQAGMVFVIWLVFDRLLKMRFNLLIACMSTVFVNMLTTPLWYYIYYQTGIFILGEPAVSAVYFTRQTQVLLDAPSIGSFFSYIRIIGSEIGRPLVIGSLPWYPIMGVVGYGVGYRVAVRARRKRAEKSK